MSAVVSAIQDALMSYDPIRTTKARIEVIPEDGKITLTGHVSTVIMKQMAAHLTYGVAGVEEVENSLVADTEMEQVVAWALATDEHTRLTTERIQINVLLGHVMLKGPVLSDKVREAAGEIVRDLPGVIDVTNGLEVSEALQAEVEARKRAKREAEEAAAAAKAAAEAAAAARTAAAAAPAIPATDVPAWALKAKADWSKEDFKAFAMAKRAAKKGKGPPVDELLAAGERARAGGAAPAVAAEPVEASALATPATDLPAWATKPKSNWTKEDFRAYAKAKRAAKQSGEELPPIPEE